jgi:thioredoxin-related protein
MKKTILIIVLVSLITSLFTNFTTDKTKMSSEEGDLQWETNYDEALKLAKKKKKPMLIFFTGSDWCGPCKLLEKELFENEEFIKLANSNLILYKADFPKRVEIAPDMKAKNEELKKYFNVKGYPTVIIQNSDNDVLGKEIGTAPTANLERYMNMINSAVENK